MATKVSIDGFLQDSNFNFDVFDFHPASAGYGARVFFRDPTNATKEIINKFSMWGGPDKRHWDDENIPGWEFTEENLQLLNSFVKLLTGKVAIIAKEKSL